MVRFYRLIFSRAWCVHTVLTTVTYTVANEAYLSLARASSITLCQSLSKTPFTLSHRHLTFPRDCVHNLANPY
jgi:hypothetical protein